MPLPDAGQVTMYQPETQARETYASSPMLFVGTTHYYNPTGTGTVRFRFAGRGRKGVRACRLRGTSGQEHSTYHLGDYHSTGQDHANADYTTLARHRTQPVGQGKYQHRQERAYVDNST